MTAKPLDEEALFHAARRIADPDARALFIDQACGDDAALAERVRTLLKMHEQEADGLEPPPVRTSDYQTLSERPGSKIGPYKLMELIGEGGFGLVFVAEQTEPVRRKVALKVIKPGMDSGQVVARFQAERQALALMDHPNIARVLDAGATDSGRPYFVMELVRGIPITGYCDQNHLAPRERLELFVSVCHAIQHAHQKGVIHRDIKPSNVLVTSHDGKPVAKVIDFGVAKAIHQPLTERTIYTNFAQMIGTPLYMSPEQAEMSGLDIDTRSDIYSLGVLLYELLTGSTPLAKKRVATAAYDEIRRLIREEEPPKPSTRLSSSDSLAAIAAQRHTEPAKLSNLVRGDLDWITMKALEKDRTRRYETANGLARDIQRHLADEVVEARPPSTAYRLHKFARKYRAVLATTVTLVLLLVAGITASTLLAVRATRAEAAARDAQQAEAERAEGERQANAELAARNTELAAEQAKVEARFKLAHKAIALFHSGVSEDMLLKNAEFTALRTKLLKEAAGFYADLEKLLAGKTDTKSRKVLADGYFQLGELTEKIGDNKEALAVQLQALAVRRELAALPGADLETRLDVARSLKAIGYLRRSTGDVVATLSAFQELRDLAAALDAEAPTEAARTQLAFGHNGIGLVLISTGKPAEAIQEFQNALAIRQKLADANLAVPDFQRDLAHSHDNIGGVLNDMGKPAEALKELQKALAIRQKLAASNPAVTEFQSDLAWTHLEIGYAMVLTGKPSEALEEHQKALAIRQKLVDANPAVTEFQRELCRAHLNIGFALQRMGKPAEALHEHKKQLAIAQKLADANPDVTELQGILSESHSMIGRALDSTGKPAEALQEHHKALAIVQKLADANPAVSVNQVQLASSHNDIGAVLWDTGKQEAALQEYQKALAIFQKLADANPAATNFQSGLGWSHNNIGGVLSETGKPAEALKEHQKALAIRQKLADANPTVPGFQLDLAMSNILIGRLHAREKRFSEAFAALEQGLAHFQKLADVHTTIPLYTNHLGWSHAYRGWAHVRAGHAALAAADLRRALALWENAKAANGVSLLERSRALALLAGLAAAGTSGVSAAEATAFADQAVGALRDAAQAGWGNWADLKEPDFDALRGREDFQKLIAQVEARRESKAMPSDQSP
jgi:serine/threonine protein kinase/tetratricopeptide (TPR) repeat protein